MADQTISEQANLQQSRSDPVAVAAQLERRGYAFVEAAAMRAMLDKAGLEDWDGFARSWEDLGPDRFMADGGAYRKRRYACLTATGDRLRLDPPQPHYQTLANNPLNGGIERIFAPVETHIALHAANRAAVEACRRWFEEADPAAGRPRCWHVEMHQFRIEARPEATGQPTPEGLHRDGVDWVLVLMVRRENVEGGVTTVTDLARRPVAEVSLSEPFDASLVDDRRVLHGVSSIAPLDPSRPAWRDVLVLTFRAEPGDGRA